MDLDSPKTWFSGVMALIAGLFAWSAKRNVAHVDKQLETREQDHKELSARVRVLENNMATREDIAGIYRRINDIGDTMNEQHGRVLEALLRQKGGGK